MTSALVIHIAMFTPTMFGVIRPFTVTLSILLNAEVFVPFLVGNFCTLVHYQIQSASRFFPLDFSSEGMVIVWQSAVLLLVLITPNRLKTEQFCGFTAT